MCMGYEQQNYSLQPMLRVIHWDGLMQIVQFDAKSVNDIEQESSPYVSNQDTIFIAVDTDKAVIAYNPFPQLPCPVPYIQQ